VNLHPATAPAARADLRVVDQPSDAVATGTDLRLAVEELAPLGGGTITFAGTALTGTNSVSSPPIEIGGGAYTLNPGGAARVAIKAGSRPIFSATLNGGTAWLELENVTFTGVAASAAGAVVSATSHVTITTPAGAAGTGTLAITNNNTTVTGGGISTATGTVTLAGDHAAIILQSNTAQGAGGVIYINSGGSVILAANTSEQFILSDNWAKNDGGVTRSTNLFFGGSHNTIRVENNSTNTDNRNGGAFYASGGLTLTATTSGSMLLAGNHAGQFGGAIYAANNGVTLNPAGGPLVFTGNTQGDASAPNAIYTTGGLNLGGNADILFYDPVFSTATTGLNKTGAGAVLFSGSNTLRGNAALAAGAVFLNGGALLDTAEPGKTLTLAPGATLGARLDTGATAASGTIRAENLALSGILHAAGAATLVIQGAATLNDITIAADTQAGGLAGLVILADAATFTGTGKVDLQSIAASGTFAVLRYDAGTLSAADFNPVLHYQGNPLDGAASRMSGAVQLSADAKTLHAIVNENESNHLVWAGAVAGAAWNLADPNWKLGATPGIATAVGDFVTFDDTAPAPAVTIEGARLDIAAMLVSATAADYVFAGAGGIRAAAGSISGGLIDPSDPRIGKLTKTGAGRLVFQNTAANTFERGIDWHEGVIAITDGAQLTTGAGSSINILAAGATLQVNPAAPGAAAGTLTSPINLAAPAATATASAAPGVAAIFGVRRALAAFVGGIYSPAPPAETASEIAPAPAAAGAAPAALAPTLIIENNAARIAIAGPITGTGDILIAGAGLTALTGENTFAGTVTLAENATLALASDAALGAPANPLVFAGDARLVATGSFTTARLIDITGRHIEIATENDAELTLAGAPGRLAGTGTVTLAGRLHAGAPGVLGATVNLRVAPAGALAVTGAQTIASLANNGRVEFRDTAASLTTATLDGTGTFAMHVNLATGDSSRLVVTGEAAGAHTLEIAATGVPADPARVNISLIEIAAGDATFAAGEITGGGMAAYALRAVGGVISLAPDGLSQAGHAILATASVAGAEWHYGLDSIHRRLGEFRDTADTAAIPPPARAGLWLRGDAWRLNAAPALAGDAFTQDTWTLAAGADKGFSLSDATFYAGAFVTAGRSTRDHDHHGRGDTTAAGAGLYAAWLLAAGWHVDAVVKVDNNKNKITAVEFTGDTATAAYTSRAYGASLEIGKRFKVGQASCLPDGGSAAALPATHYSLPATLFWFEPSAQAAVARLSGKTYTASTGLDVTLDRATAAQYRAALRAGRDLGRWSLHAGVAQVKSVTRGGALHADGAAYAPRFDGWRFEAGAGAALRLSSARHLYIDYEYSKARLYERPWLLALGLRQTW
jgi:outer membrane autotransporter protein